MKTIIGEIYKPDIALVPIGDKFTMGPFEAALASMWLNPKAVIPMHYNTFPPIEQDPAIFANFVSQFNPNIDVVVMNPDEYFEASFFVKPGFKTTKFWLCFSKASIGPAIIRLPS